MSKWKKKSHLRYFFPSLKYCWASKIKSQCKNWIINNNRLENNNKTSLADVNRFRQFAGCERWEHHQYGIYIWRDCLFFFSFRMRISTTFDNSLTKRILCACHNQKPHTHTQHAYIAHSVHSRTDIFWMFHFFLSLSFFIIQSKLILRIVSSFLFRCVFFRFLCMSNTFGACRRNSRVFFIQLSGVDTHRHAYIWRGSYMKFQEAF